jgi:hypothetical protein
VARASCISTSSSRTAVCAVTKVLLLALLLVLFKSLLQVLHSRQLSGKGSIYSQEVQLAVPPPAAGA